MELKSRGERDPRSDYPGHSLIVFGYGNPGRQDDGLGPAAAEAIAQLEWAGVTLQTNYQLNIEDADEAAKHDRVVFVDASAIGPEPYAVRQAVPAVQAAFSSHVMGPEGILAICRDYYEKAPHAIIVAIRGYDFEFGETLSPLARNNLAQAIEWVKQYIIACMGNRVTDSYNEHLPLMGSTTPYANEAR
ncbi:MAG TPA: hydrogenase maturation protease [Ktedonobacterales bacterium]